MIIAFGEGRSNAVGSSFARSKNSPRLGGLLLDVIPQQLEKYQPLDSFIVAKITRKINKQGSILEEGVI